ncbi:thioredoxin family protein [Haliea sp. E17]|uniref:thioredoxin family protein n=1 Tax=Haliea sp. E17 TaxID=3401576 RepID=UPI003AABE542
MNIQLPPGYAAGRKAHVGLWVALSLLLFVLAGCSPDPQDSSTSAAQPQSSPETSADHIAWFEGNVDAAFRAAKESGKPIFLYWGAEWCPPCHELKATIFKRPEFIRQSRLFVPVYLDGDTERAQQYGERFGVMGYPTVIIFSPDGAEITRIPGGMDIQQYVGVMDLALDSLHPVSGLVDALNRGEPLSREDWRLLAFYSWGQDRGRALGERSLAEVSLQMAEACPAEFSLEKSLLQMLAVESWAGEEGRDPAQRERFRGWVLAVLGDDALSRANLNTFAWSSEKLVVALSESDQEQEAIGGAIYAALDRVLSDSEVNVLTRLNALYGEADVLQTLSPGLPAEQKSALVAKGAALRAELGAYQQHAGLYSLAETYHLIHADAETRATLDAGMAVSKQPYYFMVVLADIERDEGNTEQALNWYRKAWEAARGPATRVQWGTIYLLALIDLAADDLAGIEATGDAILGEMTVQADALHQRNTRRMERINTALQEWVAQPGGDSGDSAGRAQVLAHFQARLQGVCEQQSERPPLCDSLAGAAGEPAAT